MKISINCIDASDGKISGIIKVFVSSLVHFIFFVCLSQTSLASELDYGLVAEPVAKGTYAFIGSTKYFSKNNGGNIVNTAYIVTDEGVIVIDTGPSYRYGKQMREYIEASTALPIIKVFITHHHPDHFLGNKAFADVPITTLAGVVDGIKRQGDAFTDNLYVLIGDWMKETEVYIPTEVISPGKISIGGHEIEIIALDGHTHSDMVILDHTTGMLFTGDLVFHDRTPALANANIEHWLSSLSRLQTLNYTYLIPGHGPITNNEHPMKQTSDYLSWLRTTLEQALTNGLTMPEALEMELPQSFRDLDILQEEYKRAVLQLYPRMEQHYFDK
jgi:uncharacterized sulfatase